VYLENPKDYVEYIKTILWLLTKYELQLKPKKCEFYKIELEFLGFIINTIGVEISPKKIKVVSE
jgi:hypothetical protein